MIESAPIPRGPRAPHFHPIVLAQSGHTGTAFDRWVRHYNNCSTCQRDDWYEPVYGFKWMCADGRALFRYWDTLTSGHAK